MENHEKKRLLKILTLLVIALSVIASAGGIFIEDLYKDNQFVNRVWLGNDLITLLIGVPLLIISFIKKQKSSLPATYVWLGTLWYMIYNYIFYMYGAAFNKFFLIHVFIFILSGYTFILGLSSLDINEIKARLISTKKIPFKAISAYMLFFGSFIGGLWIGMSINYVFTDIIPEGIIQTGHKTGVVFATDLSLLVSILFVGAILLWKKNVYGYIISTILMIKCLLYPMVLALGGVLAFKETKIYDLLTPAYILLGVGCFICLLFLMKVMKKQD